MALSRHTAVREIFLQACERNELVTLQHIFARGGADVNWRRDATGWAGLHFAAQDNYGELLELLLAQTGVDVNIRTNRNWTPLMVACWKGHENIVRRLCQFTGIQLNSRDDGGDTALHLAVKFNNPACVSVLKEVAGVNWKARTNNCRYPLTLAVFCGHAECLQIILTVPEPDLDLSVTDSDGRNIAQIAVEEDVGDRQRCVELLSGDRRVDHYWNTKKSNPVMYCLKNYKIEMARCLINTPGVDLGTVDRDGKYLENIAR